MVTNLQRGDVTSNRDNTVIKDEVDGNFKGGRLNDVKNQFKKNITAESELDRDLRYIQNVLTLYDRRYLQTSESDWCHLITIGQFAKYKMEAKMVVNS